MESGVCQLALRPALKTERKKRMPCVKTVTPRLAPSSDPRAQGTNSPVDQRPPNSALPLPPCNFKRKKTSGFICTHKIMFYALAACAISLHSHAHIHMNHKHTLHESRLSLGISMGSQCNLRAPHMQLERISMTLTRLQNAVVFFLWERLAHSEIVFTLSHHLTIYK